MDNSNGLTLTRIEAVNVLKFDHFELDQPSKLTLIRGANNQGKTTVLRLLGLCVAGADRPETVIRDGEKKASVSLGLSNGYTLKRSFTEKGEYFDILDEQGHKVPSPQKYVNDWLGEYRDFNPLAWLGMSEKDQVRVLLQAIDVRLTAAEFTATTGHEAPFEVDFAQHGLLALDALRAHFAEERKIENRIADTKKKAAIDARSTLPAAKPAISDGQRAEALLAAQAAQDARRSIETRALAATSHAAAVERIEKSKERERIDNDRDDADIADLEAQIRKIRERQVRRVLVLRELDAEITALASSAPPSAEEKEAANALIRRSNELGQEIAAAEKALSRFAAVESIEQEAADAAASAAIIDATIKILDGDLRAALMAKAKLPVTDLTIAEGRILVGGHELGFLAESQRMRIAVAIARALRPTLRVIVLDGAEQLDAATFSAFLEEIRGDGFLYLATEVTREGGPLEIVAFGETANGVMQLSEVA